MQVSANLLSFIYLGQICGCIHLRSLGSFPREEAKSNIIIASITGISKENFLKKGSTTVWQEEQKKKRLFFVSKD